MRVHEYVKALAILTPIVQGSKYHHDAPEYLAIKKTYEDCLAEAAKYRTEQENLKIGLGCLAVIVLPVLIYIILSLIDT